jgi:hypothetical protein
LNPARINHLLELTVGNRLDLPAFDPPVLDGQNRQDRCDQVPAVDLRLSIHALGFRASI